MDRASAANMIARIVQQEPTVDRVEIETGACNHPEFIRRLAQIGEVREAAQQKYDQIMGDRSHPYWNRFDRRNEAAMLEVQKLLRIMHGRK